MAKEALKKIEEAEDKTEGILKNAHIEAEKILESAFSEINEIEKATKDKAQSEKDEILKKALESAEKDYQPKLKEGKKTLDALDNLDKNKIDKAIKIIIERTVNIVGNS